MKLQATALFLTTSLWLLLAITPKIRSAELERREGEPLSQTEIHGSVFDDFGNQVLRRLQTPFQEEIGKAGGIVEFKWWVLSASWLGIKGTKKPSGAVAYLGCSQTSDGAVEMRWAVKARVKVDVGGGPLTTRVALVDTQKVFALQIAPSQKGGQSLLTASVRMLDSVDSKDGLAEQAHLTDLSTKVETSVLSAVQPFVAKLQTRLDEFSGQLPPGYRVQLTSRPKSPGGQFLPIDGFDSKIERYRFNVPAGPLKIAIFRK